MQRYFMLKDYHEIESQAIEISGETFHHMVRVMRMTVGEQVYLTFNQKRTIVAELLMIESERLVMKEVATATLNTELPVSVTIYCGFPKGDKLELITQKSTELGVGEIVGFPAATSVVKWNEKKRLTREVRLNKIALEAAEQSHREAYPQVRLLTDYSKMLEELAQYDYVLIAYEETAKEGLHSQLVETLSQLKKAESLAFIFGPEGGLTSKEVKELKAVGGKVCSLGPRILRTETAPFYALSALSYHVELLN